jgi:hypothetical protein
MAYYDKCIDIIKNKNVELLIEILIDKSKIEQNRQNLETAVDILNDAVASATNKYPIVFHFLYSFSVI